MRELTTVIVNWNTVGLLEECLRSVVAATPPDLDAEIVVVDNASSDGSVEFLRTSWPGVRVLVNDRNEGFCRANNRAIQESESRYVLLVNTDARLAEGSVSALLAYFDRDPDAAVVGPRLVYSDGAFQRWTAGRGFDLRSTANYLLMLDRLAPRWAAGIYLGSDTREPFRPGWVSSAVMALRRSAIDEVGLLDERIFVYMDDVDLCARLTDRGWRVWYAADVTAVHFMGGSAGRAASTGSPEALRALNRWFAQRHGAARARVLQALEVVGFAARCAGYAVAGLGGSPTARAGMRLHLSRVRLALEPIHA